MGSLENRASWKFALDQTHYPSLPENSCPPIVKNLIYGHSWRRVQLFPTISTVLNGAIPSSVNLHNTTSLKLPINIILCLCSTSFRAIFPDIVENDCRIVPIFKFWVIRSHLLTFALQLSNMYWDRCWDYSKKQFSIFSFWIKETFNYVLMKRVKSSSVRSFKGRIEKLLLRLYYICYSRRINIPV